jgi:hypothetical protein
MVARQAPPVRPAVPPPAAPPAAPPAVPHPEEGGSFWTRVKRGLIGGE